MNVKLVHKITQWRSSRNDGHLRQMGQKPIKHLSSSEVLYKDSDSDISVWLKDAHVTH